MDTECRSTSVGVDEGRWTFTLGLLAVVVTGVVDYIIISKATASSNVVKQSIDVVVVVVVVVVALALVSSSS